MDDSPVCAKDSQRIDCSSASDGNSSGDHCNTTTYLVVIIIIISINIIIIIIIISINIIIIVASSTESTNYFSFCARTIASSSLCAYISLASDID
jgi:hypothetical protein